MSDITNPHDKLFRETMSDRATAIDFLNNYLPPDVRACLDLSGLAIVKDSFVDQELQASYSDMLYAVEIAGEAGYVYVLFEHKSYPERWIHLQLLEYMLKIWRFYLKQQKGRRDVRLPVILPLVLYHHPDRWSVATEFCGMLNPLPEGVRRYTLNFEYLLYDLSRYADADIRGAVLLRTFILLFKHIFDDDLAERLPSILRLLREVIAEPAGLKVLEMFLRYVVNATDRIPKEHIVPLVERVFNTEEGGRILMTIAEQWKQEGFKQGMTIAEQWKQEGFEQGMQQGMQQGMRQGLLDTIEVSLRLKFGEDGLKFMAMIRLMHDIPQLQAIKTLVLETKELSEVQAALLTYS